MSWEGSDRRQHFPDDWEQRRQAVFARDGHRCVLCGAPAEEVDHVGDRDDHRIEMLRSVCKPCHGTRSGRQGATARWAKPGARQKATRRRPPEPHPGLRR